MIKKVLKIIKITCRNKKKIVINVLVYYRIELIDKNLKNTNAYVSLLLISVKN